MKILIFSILLTLVFFVPTALADRDQLRYNSMADKWEYATPKDRIKYNPMENSWSYENQGSSLQYNPMENKWEYTE